MRTPSRADTDLRLTALLDPSVPFFLRLEGNPGFEPEQVLVVGTAPEAEIRDFASSLSATSTPE